MAANYDIIDGSKVLCDVSQEEVLQEEMSICRLLGPKASSSL